MPVDSRIISTTIRPLIMKTLTPEIQPKKIKREVVAAEVRVIIIIILLLEPMLGRRWERRVWAYGLPRFFPPLSASLVSVTLLVMMI